MPGTAKNEWNRINEEREWNNKEVLGHDGKDNRNNNEWLRQDGKEKSKISIRGKDRMQCSRVSYSDPEEIALRNSSREAICSRIPFGFSSFFIFRKEVYACPKEENQRTTTDSSRARPGDYDTQQQEVELARWIKTCNQKAQRTTQQPGVRLAPSRRIKESQKRSRLREINIKHDHSSLVWRPTTQHQRIKMDDK